MKPSTFQPMVNNLATAPLGSPVNKVTLCSLKTVLIYIYIYIVETHTHTHTHNQTNSGWKDIPVIFHVNVCISILYLSFRKKYKFPYTRIGEYDVALAEQLQREKAEKQNAVRGKYWCLSVCLSVLLAVICCHNFVRLSYYVFEYTKYNFMHNNVVYYSSSSIQIYLSCLWQQYSWWVPQVG